MRREKRFGIICLLVLLLFSAGLFVYEDALEESPCGLSAQIAKIIKADTTQGELLVISLDTENQSEISSKDDYLNATVSIRDFNASEPYFMGDCKAKGHGTTSWSTSKKPFQIKFGEKEAPIQGGQSAKKWLLISNCFDKTLSRNALAYSLMNVFEEIHNPVSFSFAELYINGEYQGLYLLCSKAELDTESAVALQNGSDVPFLLEMTGEDRECSDGSTKDVDYILVNGHCYSIKDSNISKQDKPDSVSEKVEAIKRYMEAAMETIAASSWNEITDLVDVESFAATYIIQEIFANTDVGCCSFFIYRDSDGKLCCGPVWDFDIGGGNTNYAMGNEETCPAVGYLWANGNYYYGHLLEHREFVELVRSLFKKYDTKILDGIERANPKSSTGYLQTYQEAIHRNFEKHKIMGECAWPEPKEVYLLDTPEKQFSYLYRWLSTRYDYLKQYYNIA